jgi:hypothetical protein
VMLGTKCPSITSTCTHSAPPLSMARTSSPSLEKSAARMDGAMIRGRVILRAICPWLRPHRSSGLKSPTHCHTR